MRVLRFPVAFVLSVVFTGSVFWALWALINKTVDKRELKPAAKIEFTRMRKDTEAAVKKTEKPQLEKMVQAPSAPSLSRVTFQSNTEKFAVAPPTVEAKAMLGAMRISVGGSDRDVQPLVRIEPDYPPRAAQRGVEGWVIVQFTITPEGGTKDAVVVDAEPKGMFDQAAVKAVSRWKYNPKVEDGVPVERRGMQIKLSFKLEK